MGRREIITEIKPPARGHRPKRLYLGLLFFGFAVSLSAACVLIWVLHPRLAAISPFLSQTLVSAVLAYTAVFAVLYGSICVSLFLRRPFRLAELSLPLLERAYPFAAVLAGRLGISDQQVRQSLAEIASELATSRLTLMSSGRIACIAAACLDHRTTACAQAMAAEFDCDFHQPRSVLDARNWIMKERPVALVAVACDPDFVNRITDLEYRFPMVIIRARGTAEGEVGGDFDPRELLEALESLRERIDATIPSPETVAVRSRR